MKYRNKLCGNCMFPQNSHARKSGETSVFTQWKKLQERINFGHRASKIRKLI